MLFPSVNMKDSPVIVRFRREFIIYILPPLLIITTYFAFRFFTDLWGKKEGFVAGMLFYWFLACLAPVLLWVNKSNRRRLLRIKKPAGWELFLLMIPVGLSFLYGISYAGYASAGFLFIVLALVFSFAGALSEEMFWRGLYYDHHQGNLFHAAVVPAVWYGVWQYVPLSVYPSGIGHVYFILAAIGMGLCWGIVTFYTRSVFWAVVSHLLVNLLAGYYYLH